MPGIGPTVRCAKETLRHQCGGVKGGTGCPGAPLPRLAVGPVTDTTVHITWQTEEPADAAVHSDPA